MAITGSLAPGLLARHQRQAGLGPGSNATLESIDTLYAGFVQGIDRTSGGQAGIANGKDRFFLEFFQALFVAGQLIKRNVSGIDDMSACKRLGAAQINHLGIGIDQCDGSLWFNVRQALRLAPQFGENDHKETEHQGADQKHVVGGKFQVSIHCLEMLAVSLYRGTAGVTGQGVGEIGEYSSCDVPGSGLPKIFRIDRARGPRSTCVNSCAMKALFHSPTALGALCVLLLIAVPSGAQDTELTQIKERELEAVREKISNLKKSMDSIASERDRITGELQEAEVDIAEKRNVLRDLERQRQFSEKKKAELDGELASRNEALAHETGQLAAQVSAAYTSGKQERIKLLLNQHDPATLGRLTAYYRYMSDFRGSNIQAVNGMIEDLNELRGEVAREEARLAGLARARLSELTELNAAQVRRTELLASLKQRISDEGDEVKRLAAEEQDLTRLIAELTSILSDYPITSEEQFSKFKGRLTWPIAGRLIHDFGQPRAGSDVKWNGVVLAAPRGREVRSVYHGRVIFADWLAGMGLLVIVDHGESFMSLYGYNEATLKSVGDWVAPGDVIATVGDSGGQSQSGLYFEIRQGTRPENPRVWVSKQPKFERN